MNLTENQIKELYNVMTNLIESRRENEKRKEITPDDFKTWIIGLKEQYTNEDETE